MGTDRWIIPQIGSISEQVDTVIELGAGEGHLLKRVKQHFPALECIAYDLLERPAAVPESIEWHSGNFVDQLETMKLGRKTAVLACLILHHLTAEELVRLGLALRDASALIAVEPDRSKLSLSLGRLLLPFVGEVTRADMITSIRAGFSRRELAHLLDRESISERVWLGGRRVVFR
jgi:hypothetical protein